MFIDELLQRDEHSLWSLLRAANCLQVSGLYEMIRDTLAQNTEKSVSEIEHDLSRSFKQCAKVIFLAATMFTASDMFLTFNFFMLIFSIDAGRRAGTSQECQHTYQAFKLTVCETDEKARRGTEYKGKIQVFFNMITIIGTITT